MMNLKNLLASSTFALFLCVGCSIEDKKSINTADVTPKYNKCDANVVADAQKLIDICRNIEEGGSFNKEAAQNCLDTAQTFLNNYPGISCIASIKTDGEFNEETILASELREELIDNIKERLEKEERLEQERLEKEERLKQFRLEQERLKNKQEENGKGFSSTNPFE